MTETRVFRSYDFLTGDVGDTFAYDLPAVSPRVFRAAPETLASAAEKAPAAAESNRGLAALLAAGAALLVAFVLLLTAAGACLGSLNATGAELRGKLELATAENTQLELRLSAAAPESAAPVLLTCRAAAVSESAAPVGESRTEFAGREAAHPVLRGLEIVYSSLAEAAR